jgi:hypothetical protein
MRQVLCSGSDWMEKAADGVFRGSFPGNLGAAGAFVIDGEAVRHAQKQEKPQWTRLF